MVGVLIHPANIQDRDGASKMLATIRKLYPWLRHIFADGGYAGDKLRGAAASIISRRLVFTVPIALFQTVAGSVPRGGGGCNRCAGQTYRS